MYKTDKPKHRKTIYVPIKIGNIHVNAVLDTATQVTVMGEKLYKKIKPSPILTESIKLKGAGKDNFINGQYAEDVKIQIGDIKTKCRIVVGNMSDEFLLGLDFLQRHRAVINLDTYTVQLNGTTINLSQVEDGNHDKINVYRVTVNKRTVIPPQSMQFVKIQTDKPVSNPIMVQPQYKHHGLVSPNSVIDPQQNTSLLFRNATDKYVTIKRGQEVGMAIEINEVFDLEDDEIAYINKISTEISNTKQTMTKKTHKSQNI